MRVLISAVCLLLTAGLQAQDIRLYIHLDAAVRKTVRGRLYIFSQPDTSKGVQDPDPFTPNPTFIKDITNWDGQEPLLIDSTVAAYPVKLNQLKPGYYKMAAILDINTEERVNTAAPGNLYSPKDVLLKVAPGENTEAHFYISKTFKERTFRESDSVKQVVFKSKLLSDFHKKDMYIKAGIKLPASYGVNPGKQYPVVFIIPGWGGTHYDIVQAQTAQRYGMNLGKEKIYVYLNPESQTAWGLHAFVDSRVNGSWGKALVTELIPHLQQQYRIGKDGSQYFIAGQSSGGYGALWLQLHYPDAFGACWAVSPDPVDFRDFTSINLYDPAANMYTDSAGKVRPFFSWQGQYVSTIKNFMQFEHFMGDGGQQQSFEAEFGVRGKDGKPALLFDRHTGVLNKKVVESWKAYDLGAYFQQQWPKLKNKLRNKIHVFAGAEDNFYLDRSVTLFQQRVNSLQAAAVADLIPGANHWTIWNPAFTQRMQKEFDNRIRNTD
jgi:S-formylglutathione hydrolase FrmB